MELTEDQILNQRIAMARLSPQTDAARIQVARELAAEDPVWFVNHLGWTFDPRPDKSPHHFPFLLYDYEEKLLLDVLARVRTGRDLLIEKSRDMGATWTILYALIWNWLFTPGFQAAINWPFSLRAYPR